jgi:hypothetical protein
MASTGVLVTGVKLIPLASCMSPAAKHIITYNASRRAGSDVVPMCGAI